VVTAWSSVPSEYAVSVTVNAAPNAASVASQTGRPGRRRGRARGARHPGHHYRQRRAFAGFEAALSVCPDVEVAGEVTWALRGRQGRKSDPEWAQRNRLLRAAQTLTADELAKVQDANAPGRPVRRPREVLAGQGTAPQAA